MASATHMFRDALSESEREKRADGGGEKRLYRQVICGHHDSSIIDRLLLIYPIPLNNFLNLDDLWDTVNISTAHARYFHSVMHICARYKTTGGFRSHALCTFRLLIDWLTRGRVNFHWVHRRLEPRAYRRSVLCARGSTLRTDCGKELHRPSAPYSHSVVKSIQSKIKRVRRTVKI